MPALVDATFALPTTLASIDDARRWASDHAREARLDPDAIAELEVAMTEALSNVIRHSYGERPDQRVLLSLHIDDAKLSLSIRDHGRAFDAAEYQAPDLDVPSDSGYGVFLMEELMDEVIREPLDDGGTLVSLVSYRKGPK
jgi:serine/threonine-protein kinase RsbW